MLIGSPGTKKSTAIKVGARLLRDAGYTTFAAKKTRQEKFLLDLSEQHGSEDSAEDILDSNLFGTSVADMEPAECFVAADEFNTFIGQGNTDFISILGDLWDYDGVYDYRLKNSKSVSIKDPTISILGGNTPTGFSQAFPTEVIGQGFFSRLLLIYGEPSGIRHTFPPPPDLELQTELIAMLHTIRNAMIGEVTLAPEAKDVVDIIYKTWKDLPDVRFEHYSNRRLPHLLKLCLVVAAARASTIIEKEDVIYANTLLSYTEQLMPKALGEFGKARNSDVTHKVMLAVDAALLPLTLQDLWKVVHTDLENRNQLVEILYNLIVAEKIQHAQGGYLPIKQVIGGGTKGTVDWGLLTDEEMNLT